ncbi:MAG: rhomboid family intramembrane serine protease [Caldilineaceae bacterium SB0662_bin_25]|nr:rhomboid family intramembrane serine protease [Caldilineaceae bacterium SB0662_bin_25]
MSIFGLPPRTAGPPPAPTFYIPLVPPRISRALIAVNLLVFAATFIYGLLAFRVWNGPTDLRVLCALGMKSNWHILQGENWRLFTAMFLHIGPIHLISNLIGLFWLGPIIEGHFGHMRFTVIYLLGGLLGSIASYAFSPAPSAGASGAVFALLGATIIYFYRFRENMGRQGKSMLQSALAILVINLFLGFSVTNVDNWGHMGGLAGGAIIAVGLLPRYRPPSVLSFGRQPLVREPRIVRGLSWSLLCALLFYTAFQVATLTAAPSRFAAFLC